MNRLTLAAVRELKTACGFYLFDYLHAQVNKAQFGPENDDALIGYIDELLAPLGVVLVDIDELAGLRAYVKAQDTL